jgi:glycine hydroxymethyltransferase
MTAVRAIASFHCEREIGITARTGSSHFSAVVAQRQGAPAAALLAEGVTLIIGGTDNHLIRDRYGREFWPRWTGRRSCARRRRHHDRTSRSSPTICGRPYVRADCASGTPACTTRGMNENDMASIALWIVRTLRRPEDAKTIEATRAEVRRTCREHPVPGLSQASAGGMRRSGA